MIPENVTLIVKAPNQQIEDQNVECQSSWTVRQLKGHLAEVYPSKPSTDEQKIIYSGRLLDDNTILKDVLRTYEFQIAHTMHLVCTPTHNLEPQPVNNTDGLRRRNVEPIGPPTDPPRAETRQNDQNHNVEMQNYFTTFVNNYGRVPPYQYGTNMGDAYLPIANDPAQFANHMMMMHQAYMQYMQQYGNMWQAPGPDPAAPPPEPQSQPAPAAEAPPAEAPPAAAPDDQDEVVARDWLDHLYAASRLAILFSLVYLYGSPARFLLVLLLIAAGYLHQIGFFRDLHINAQPANNRRGEQPQQPAADNQQQLADNAAQPADNTQATNIDNQQSLLAVTWMIFTSFFASLIPDTNN